MDTFSVIVPIYHGEQYIPGIIKQIELCKQHLKSKDYIEILFVNDAPDTPLDLNWKSEIVAITVINTDRNIGIHGARVKGFKQCMGEYILFLDQDDKIVPEYFVSQIQKLGKNGAVVCKALNGGQEYYADDTFFSNIPYKQFMLKEWNLILSPGQVLIKRDVIPSAWTENVLKNNGADDWFLWICIFAEGCHISLNDRILYEHVLQEFNASKDVMSMLHSEQEMLEIIYTKKILSDYDFGFLLRGFYKKNRMRTQKLYAAKEKLDYLSNWIKLKERNICFNDYLSQFGYRKIAIYGCGILGEYVYEELKTVVEIKYFIDRNAAHIQKTIPVYALTDYLPEVDCIILTLMGKTEDVEEKLKENGFENIILLKNWDNWSVKNSLSKQIS